MNTAKPLKEKYNLYKYQWSSIKAKNLKKMQQKLEAGSHTNINEVWYG